MAGLRTAPGGDCGRGHRCVAVPFAPTAAPVAAPARVPSADGAPRAGSVMPTDSAVLSRQ